MTRQPTVREVHVKAYPELILTVPIPAGLRLSLAQKDTLVEQTRDLLSTFLQQVWQEKEGDD